MSYLDDTNSLPWWRVLIYSTALTIAGLIAFIIFIFCFSWIIVLASLLPWPGYYK